VTIGSQGNGPDLDGSILASDGLYKNDNNDNGQLELLLSGETQAVSDAGIENPDQNKRIVNTMNSDEARHEHEADPDLANQPVGARLRSERERRGWSREEVAARLKLQVSVVRRIEDDDFSGIAHAVYLRGYLTSYARLVGVPTILADKVVAMRGEQAPLVSTGTISRSRYLLDRYSVSATYLILTGLVVGPAVWLATHGGLQQNLARTEPLDTASESVPAQTLAAATDFALIDAGAITLEKPPLPAAVTEPPPIVASMAPFSAIPQPAIAPAPALQPGTHTLVLKLVQASWVEVTSSTGEKLEYGLLAAGTERSYSSTGVVSVRLGNAEGAQLVADGKPVDLAPYRRANVAHLRLFGAGALATRVDY